MPSAASAPPPTWLHHLEDEADAAYLYRELAQLEPDRHKSELYQKLASVEDRHVELWRTLLAQNGHATEVPVPSRAARFRAWLARRLGSGFLLPMLLEEEGREVKGYLSLYQEAPDAAVAPTALRLAKESKEHAETLAQITGGSGEPWHKTGAGGVPPDGGLGVKDGAPPHLGPGGGGGGGPNPPPGGGPAGGGGGGPAGG